MIKKQIIITLLIITGLTTSSCTLFTPDIRTAPQGELPEMFSLYTSDRDMAVPWWQEFNDVELNALIAEALSGNFSLKEAWQRLKQAQAVAVKTGAASFPDVSLNAGNSRTRRRTDDGSGSSSLTASDYSLGLASSYELDIWGRIRSEQEATRLETAATREDLNAAAMTLTASAATLWINIISQRMQKQLLKRQLETNKTYLELVELRFRKGVVSALDVYQQRQAVEQVRGQIPLIESEEQLLMHELSLLLAKPPRSEVRITRKTLPDISQVPATGLPADILASRPDVRAAGLRLQASDWNAAVAKADRLPALKLTGTASFGADHLDIIFDNWLLRLAGNLTAPIFDGKRRKAEVDRSLAKADENLWAYRRAVYTAIKETEDALIREKKQRQHLRVLEAETEVAQKAFDQAIARYRKGLSDYLPVLTQLQKVQRLEKSMIQQKTGLLIYRVNLYRALGGTWTDSLMSEG
ncbi:efflux transporter outer membrane subunit [Desulfonema magnum]|uniref:RND efflux system, outer membrane lipoprotein, NodT family n=1 Tax=Desulfonema magnum TaxID=45655 RepID=A0A975GQT6_9BACT|nr:efflux transporter outer membrane subunit [Desulfonema magnum]QTA89293.1 putative RND efflux system, outer membrane lipoprotein, NodT family [Desulfonema magnum]